jgi:hypothetical protein
MEVLEMGSVSHERGTPLDIHVLMQFGLHWGGVLRYERSTPEAIHLMI